MENLNFLLLLSKSEFLLYQGLTKYSLFGSYKNATPTTTSHDWNFKLTNTQQYRLFMSEMIISMAFLPNILLQREKHTEEMVLTLREFFS